MNIFLDLDGVVADFDTAFFNYFGMWPIDVPDDVMWLLIDRYQPKFFLHLPMVEGADGILASMCANGVTPIVLTACPKHNYVESATQKKTWSNLNIQRFFFKQVITLPVIGGKNKFLFKQENEDVLIDDFIDNITPWIESGGRGIHHTAPERTVNQLEGLYNEYRDKNY